MYGRIHIWDQKGEVDKNTFIHTLCYISVNFSMGSNFVVFLTFQNYKSKHMGMYGREIKYSCKFLFYAATYLSFNHI